MSMNCLSSYFDLLSGGTVGGKRFGRKACHNRALVADPNIIDMMLQPASPEDTAAALAAMSPVDRILVLAGMTADERAAALAAMSSHDRAAALAVVKALDVEPSSADNHASPLTVDTDVEPSSADNDAVATQPQGLQELCDQETPRTGLAIAYGEFKLVDSVAASIGARDNVLVAPPLSYCL